MKNTNPAAKIHAVLILALLALVARGDRFADALEESAEGRASRDLRDAADNVRRAADMIAAGDMWAARSFLVVVLLELFAAARRALKWHDLGANRARFPSIAFYREAVQIVRSVPREESAETYVTVFNVPGNQNPADLAAWYSADASASVRVFRYPPDLRSTISRVWMEGTIVIEGFGSSRLLRQAPKGPRREAEALQLAKRWASMLEALLRSESRRVAKVKRAA